LRNWEKWNEQKGRYLQLDRDHQLGSLASNIARIKNQSRNGALPETAVVEVIDESQDFIEWTVQQLDTVENEADLSLAAELAELGRKLAQWKLNWKATWADEALLEQVAIQAEAWSERILGRSGLLEQS
jgi:hypothetical protein